MNHAETLRPFISPTNENNSHVLFRHFGANDPEINAPCAVKKSEDEGLVDRFKAGELAVFDLLVIKYQRRLTGAVGAYVFDSELVKDIIQETFIRAYKGLAGFRNESQFYTWIYRIALNTAFNSLRISKRFQHTVDVDDPEQQHELVGHLQVDGPEKSALDDDLRQATERAIERLPMSLKTALVLREIEGFSYEQIAGILSIRVGTVKSRIARAREQVIKRTEHLYRSY